MKINKLNYFQNNNITYKKSINKYYLNFILSKLKIFLNLLFELKNINGRVYFIGFPDFTLANFSVLFKKFNVINLKSEIWVNGLLSNSVYMSRYFSYNRVKSKLKKNKLIFLKEFKNILNKNITPDLIIFYKNDLETKSILKECHKLKIPVILIFDNLQTDNIYTSKYISTIFSHNTFFNKELFIYFFYKVLKSLLRREKLYINK